MHAQDASFLQAAMNSCYEQGMAALRSGEMEKAKWFLYSSAEHMLQLAKEMHGQMRERLLLRAEEVCAFVERIEANLRSTTDAPSLDAQDAPTVSSESELPSSVKACAPPGEVGFDQVAGLEEVKREIRRLAIYPQNHAELYRTFQKKRGGGILLYGVPGTGKTMIAGAIAKELGATFYPVKCSDILSKWFGEAEQNIRALFEEAAREPRAVIFFDEFDALGCTRDTDSSTMKRVIPELLVGMQGAREAKNTLLVLAATNRPWDLDSAFLRPGRFDVAIHIPLPDQAARRAILKIQLSQVPGAEALDLDDLVRGSEGFSGADMVHLCERLKDHAIERIIEGEGEMLLTKADVEYALANVSSSVLPEDLRSIEKYRVGRMGGGI